MSRLMDFFMPLSPLSDVDQLIQSALEPFPRFATEAEFPPVNIWEKDEKVFVEAELPGITADQIDISITGSQLSIKGERKAPEAPEGAWGRQERAYGSFLRIIDLPWDIDPASVEAKLASGVLTVALSKSARSVPKKISVQNT